MGKLQKSSTMALTFGNGSSSSEITSTYTITETSTILSKSVSSTFTESTATITKHLQTTVTQNDILSTSHTTTVGTTLSHGEYNKTALDDEGPDGVLIVGIVVPIGAVVCVVLAVILILIVRKRYKNSTQASPRNIPTPKRDYPQDSSQNNAYGSLQDRRSHEHRYCSVERSTDVSPCHPNNTPVETYEIVMDEQFQPKRNFVNGAPDLEAYTNAYSARQYSDNYLHVI